MSWKHSLPTELNFQNQKQQNSAKISSQLQVKNLKSPTATLLNKKTKFLREIQDSPVRKWKSQKVPIGPQIQIWLR